MPKTTTTTTTPLADRKVLTREEFAQVTGRNIELVRRWLTEGRIRGVKAFGTWFIPRSEVTKMNHQPRRATDLAPSRAAGKRK